MSKSFEDFRSEANKVLKPLGAELSGVLFNFSEEVFVSAAHGTDMDSLAEVLGKAKEKMVDGKLLLGLDGSGGRLIAAVSFKKDASVAPKDISGLLSFLVRNILLEEERDRDGLTGFLKKEAFRNRMLEIALAVKNSPTDTSRERKGKSPSLSFFHLDLDHFKEINDTLGHRFGDEVLRSFARKVRVFFSQTGQAEVLMSRLGGEEFGVLVPYHSAADALTLGEKLCEFIRTSKIPTPEEIERYRSANPEFKTGLLPKVTASIGVATADSAVILRVPPEALAGELDQLYERADVATYVAKKLGRDRIIAFERILAEGGTVLDYDERTGITTIDLGSDAGVDVGDVFRVYDNRKFTGREPIIQPGSQNKVIGYFPRVVLGELEIILCQPQVSFALRRSADFFIPSQGFLLEWVTPSERGKRTLADRRSRDRRRDRFISPRSLFESKLRESQASEKFTLVLFYLDNLSIIREQRGSSAVKELYKDMAAELERLTVPGDVVSSISSEFLGFLPSSLEAKGVADKIGEMKSAFSAREKVTFSAVVYDASKDKLDRTRSLDIAKKGAEIARFKGVDQVLFIDPQALLTKLFFYHEHGESDKVVQEFQELSSLGLSDDKALLCYAESLSYLGRREEAFDAARDYLEKNPKNLEALEVTASTAFELGRFGEAARAYETLSESKKSALSPWQWRDFAIALLYLGEPDKALKNLERALEGDPTDASAIYHKGEVLFAQGQKDKARQEFMRAFELGYRELSPQAAKLLGEG